MLGAPTTGVAIEAFESRFTWANGAPFLIAANGKEAIPISEAEGIAWRDLYRRRMVRARWIRRLALLGTIPFLMLLGQLLPRPSEEWRPFLQQLTGLVLLGVPALGLIQHPLTSFLTIRAIERPLARRITTRFEKAVTRNRTPLGRLAIGLIIGAVAIHALLGVVHALVPTAEYAAHMRVLYGLRAGNESWTALITGNLSKYSFFALVIGLLLMSVDRRKRREAEAAAAAERDAGARSGFARIA